MKKIIIIFVVFILPLVVIAGNTTYEEIKQKNQNLVSGQKETNKKNKEMVLKEVRDYFTSINKELGIGSKTQLEIPIESSKINDVQKQEQQHATATNTKKIYGFINGDSVSVRSDATVNSDVLGKFDFNEQVEVLAMTKTAEKIDGYTDNWILIRRSDESEGWVFGRYLQKKQAVKDQVVAPKKNGSIGVFEMPADGVITSSFGNRVHPISKKRNSFHSGIDIGAPTGTPVKSAAVGVVKISEFKNNGYGNLIVVQHEDNISTYYGHLSKRRVNVGDKIKAGQLIGDVGSTGASTGPHLHFEVRRGDQALNPDAFIR